MVFVYLYQGILDLYEFQKKYPYAEGKVNAHLAKTGTYFQSYIRRGLANIAAEEDAANAGGIPVVVTPVNSENDWPGTWGKRTSSRFSLTEAKSTEEPAESYKQKLLRLQQMFGYRSDGVSAFMISQLPISNQR